VISLLVWGGFLRISLRISDTGISLCQPVYGIIYIYIYIKQKKCLNPKFSRFSIDRLGTGNSCDKATHRMDDMFFPELLRVV